MGGHASAEAARAERLAGRVHVTAGAAGDRPLPAARVVEDAVVGSRVVAIDYRDRHGTATRREVEPVALVGGRDDAWYLVGHCRLRAASAPSGWTGWRPP